MCGPFFTGSKSRPYARARMAQPTGRPASLPRRLQWPATEAATQPQSIFRERCILSVYGNVSPIFYLASHRKLQATWRTEVIV